MQSSTQNQLPVSSSQLAVNSSQLSVNRQLITFLLLLLITTTGWGQTNYYYKGSGNVTSVSSWSSTTDLTGASPANFSANNCIYNLRNASSISLNASWTVGGTSSKIIIGDGSNACNFTVGSNFVVTAPATDVNDNGTITRTSSGVQSWGTLNIKAGGTYDHNYATGTLPAATWDPASTLLVSADLVAGANNFAGVTFGNVTFRNTAATTMFTSISVDQTATIAGNLNLQGTGAVNMSNQAAYNSTLTVNGNVNISGNSTFRIENQTTASQTVTKRLLVLGNYDQSNGTMDLATNTSTLMTNRQCILEVRGNFKHTGGTLTENAAGASPAMITRVLLSKTTGTQTLESTGQSNSVDFNVAGSNAQCVVEATKTFTLSSGSSFRISNGSSNPDLSISGTFVNISTVTNGFGNAFASSGNISLNDGGTYVHNTARSVADYLSIAVNNSGSTFIYRGSSTLTPSIALSGRTYHHLTIESTSGALSLSGTGTSSFIVNGNLTIGANCTFGPNITGTPGHSIKGNITIGSGGTLNYNPVSAGTVNLNGTVTQTLSGAGTFTTGANATLAVGATSTIDFGATATIAGSGTFTTASGSTLITANTLGINGSLTLSTRSLNAGTNYTFNNSVPSAQVTGAAVTAANNLTVNNSAGLTLSVNTAITGTLTLSNGLLTTNGKTLTLSNSATGSNSSYILADATGTVTMNAVTTAKTIPIGTSTAYAPLTVTAGSSTNYTAYVTGTTTWPGSCTPATTSQMVNLAWGLSGSNAPSQVVFQWPAGSQAGSFTPGTSCDLGRYNATCPYNVTNIGAASGSGPYTLTCTSGLGTTNNIYVIGNENSIYVSATPTITGAATATAFTTTYGTESAAQSFSVSGSNLTANLVATAQTGFEVATAENGAYQSSVTFTQSSGSASGTVWVRLKSDAAVNGTYNNVIAVALTSTDATTRNITTAATGNAVSKATPNITTEPTATDITQGESLASSNLTGGVASVAGTFGWTNSSTIPSVGTSSQGYTFTPNDGTNYNNVTGSVNVTVNAVTTPTITVNGNSSATATAFTTTYGTASSVQTFTIAGTALMANITATAPTGFEVSNDGTTYGSTATFTQTSGSASGTLRIRLAATAEVTGSYNNVIIALTSTDASTVNITTASSGNSVTAKGLIITGLTAASRDYNGLTTVSVTGTPEYSGLVNGQTFSVSGTVTWAFADANAGSNKTLSRTGSYNAPSTNYSVTQPTLTATINTVALTITGLSAADKVYNGNTTVSVTGPPVYSGLVNGETFSVSGTVTWAFPDANAGANKTLTRTGSYNAPSANYTVTQPTLTASITMANQTITFGSLANKTTADVPYTISATASSGLTVSFSSSNTAVATISGNTVTIVGAGETTITASQAGNGNYEAAASVDQTLTVTLAPTTILGWQFGSPESAGNENSYGSTANNTNVNSSTLSRGAGVTSSSLPRGFASTNYTGATSTPGTKSNAIAADEYMSFTVSAKSGYKISLSALDAILRRSSAGPNTYRWRYSLDGTTFTDIGLSDVSYTLSGTEGNQQATIDLSSISALQNVPAASTITFRLYSWGATSTGANFGIGRTPTSTTNNALSVSGFVEVDNSPAITPSAASVSGMSYSEGAGPSAASSITLSATNLTDGGGTITVSGSTNFEVSTTSSTTGFGSSATLAYTGTGTLASNTVWIRLKAGLPGGTYSSETISINGGGGSTSVTASGTVIPGAPANDLCGSATSTTIGSISGTTVAATVSSPLATGVGDVWYTFTPSSTCSANFTVSTTTTGQNLDIYVYSGTCASPGTAVSTGGAGSNSTTDQSATFPATGGNTYYIRVQLWSGTAGGFSLQISDPYTAAAVTSANASGLSSTTATLNGSVSTLGVCPNTTEKGFVYAETATNSNPEVGGTGVTKVSVADLTTGSYSSSISGLSNLTSYSYNAYMYDGTTYTYSNTVRTFTTIPPATNDECSTASSLTVSSSVTCNTSTNGTLNGATESIGRASCDFASGTIADVWYSFVAANTSHNITVIPEASFDPVVEVRSGACSGTTAIGCEDRYGPGVSETLTVTGLTIGQTYFVRVYSYTSGVPSTPGFTICASKAVWENFETGTKGAYAAANVTLNSGSWNLNDAILETTTSDRKIQGKAMRIRNTGTASMNFDLSTGVQSVTINHAIYGSDLSSTWVLEASTDGGTNWTAYQSSAITTSSTTLALETFSVNLNNTVRLRVRKTGGGANRINIDDIDYTPMPVSTPTFSLGENSGRCPAAGTVTYTATANNTTGITYSLDATSLAAGNTINASTGAVTYVAGWSGTSTITASAAGTSGPATATHTVSHVCYTVTYNANGGTGTVAATSHVAGTSTTLAANSYSRDGFTFLGWNTAENGSGTFYLAGASYTVNADITLYARWATTAPAPGFKIWVGGTGNWNVNDNWTPSGVPGASDDIYIDAGTPTLNTSVTISSGRTLTITDQGGLTINPGSILTITGTADFGGRPVTLKSDATGTASIGQVSGLNGSNLTGASAVTVERYMPGERRWRMLTAPLVGDANNSIYYNWQNNGTAAGSTGAIFWGPAASGGIYPGGVGYNILSFNSSSGAQGAWANVTNTQESGSLFDQNTNKSYIAFVTGPYNTTGNYITGSAVATTLRATGTLRTGQVQFTGLIGGVGSDSRFHMIGNPYASAVNFSAINAQNVNAFYYVWNPNEGTLGRYEPVDRTASSRLLESGQAFLVAVSEGSTGSVTFDENDKSSTTTNQMFRTQNTNPRATMRLFKTVNGTLTKFDEAWVDYQPNANPNIDGNDALKPNNFTENMSIFRFDKDLMVERRPLITVNDTLQLRLWRTQATNYQIQLTMENFSLPEGSTAVLEDRYLNTSTPIVLSGQQTINFSVNADPASTGERFRIVFRPSVVTSVDNLNGARGFSVYPNPLAKGSNAQLEFRNKPAGKYTVTLYTITGVQVQQSILTHGGGTGMQSFRLASQLSAGTYIAEITNTNGVKEKVKVVVE